MFVNADVTTWLAAKVYRLVSAGNHQHMFSTPEICEE
jgi:hypothetical protein